MLEQRPRSLGPTLLPAVPWLQAPPIHQEGGMYARQKQAASLSIALGVVRGRALYCSHVREPQRESLTLTRTPHLNP